MRYEDEEKGFLHKLRSRDHASKTRIMIVATLVIMLFVLYFWLAFFNNILAGVAARSGSAEHEPAPQEAGPWDYIKGGFAGMGRALGNFFESPREYQIVPGQ